jgi:Fe-S-cluster containining protein
MFYPSNLKIEGKCSQCGDCCRKLSLIIDDTPVKTEEDFKKAQEADKFCENLEIVGKNADDELYFKCKLLVGNLCSKYEERPLMCKEYPSPDMAKFGGSLYQNCTLKMSPRKGFKFYLENYY